MMTITIALRSIQRNRRRSLITGLTITVGVVALLMVSALMTHIILDFQTGTVRRSGHFTVFRYGFYAYGAGNPSAYAISDYKQVMTLIQNDPELAGKLTVVTPYQAVFGSRAITAPMLPRRSSARASCLLTAGASAAGTGTISTIMMDPDGRYPIIRKPGLSAKVSLGYSACVRP